MLTVGAGIENTQCPVCGVHFGVPYGFMEWRRHDGKQYWCCNGHALSFHETEAQKLEKQLIKTRNELQAQVNEATHGRLVAEKAAATERRKLRAIQKRVAAGVCPCCTRSFENLQKHMRTKHKNYALAEPAKQIADSKTESVQ